MGAARLLEQGRLDAELERGAGPHVGQDMVWPMSLIMKALTSNNEPWYLAVLPWRKPSHESYRPDNALALAGRCAR